MVDRSTVIIVQRYLRTLREHGVAVGFGVVFGSQASGTAHEWSDIDVVVVSPRFDVRRERKDVDLLWRVAARTDSRIEPVPCGERQWEESGESAIIEIARRQGERIPCPPD
jgi:predicted nucleotidyltransferase